MRRALEAAYVASVAALAAWGFSTGSTATILTSVALGLPTSILALPGYYLIYGLLALVPGANPTSAAGSGGCALGGDCVEAATGDPASWFSVTTDVVGVLALSAAALLNVVLLRARSRRRLPVDDDFAGTPPGW